MTIIIQLVVSLILSIYSIYILNSEIVRFHKEKWTDVDEELRPTTEPLKALPIRSAAVFFIVSVLFGILPVALGWSWVVPVIGIVLLEILLFGVVEYDQHRQTLFWFVLQFASAFAFCVVGKVNFEVVTYAFFAFVAIFICDCVKKSSLKEEGSDSDDER